ncbi:MAG: hypothetical protein LBF12_00530 [Christensenellaceae bacterium]|jgi:hypothetical protein|nr:hypothetical protein [Christensenellaceae bacterium]
MKLNVKKRKINILLLLSLFILVMVMALSACNDKESTHKGRIEININNLDDLKAINDKLGSDYNEALFRLNNDIIVDIADSWQPIGYDIDNSFRGTFDGRGSDGANHKITIIAEAGVQSNYNHFGLFGYLYGSTIKNLSLDINYTIETFNEITYVGGLAGYAFGRVTLENIEATGLLEPIPARQLTPSGGGLVIDKQVFVGGLIGYGIGEFSIKDIDSTIDIEVKEEYVNTPEYSQNNSFEKAYVGGIVAYLRTPDISTTNAVRNRIEDIKVNSNIEAEALNVYAGGVVGVVYNSDILTLDIAEGGNNILRAKGDNHTYVGGGFGLIDNCTVTRLYTKLTIKIESVGGTNSSRSFGGVAGYITNQTLLKDVEFNADIHTEVSADSQAYGGGIAGTLSNSTIKATKVGLDGDYGFIINNMKGTADDYYSFFIEGSRKSYMLTNYAGLAGRIHGKSVIDVVTVNFRAYQGIVVEISSSIDVEKDDNDDPINVTTKDTPTITDAKYYVDKIVAKVYEDKTAESERVEKYIWNKIGTEIEEESGEEPGED